MHRRELLRLLVVTGVAGCTTGLGDDEVAVDARGPSTGPTTVTAEPAAPPATDVTPPADPSPPQRTPAAAADPTDDASSTDPGPTPAAEPTGDPDQPPTDVPTADEPGGGDGPTPTTEPPLDPAPDDTTGSGSDTGQRTVVAIGRDALGLPAARPGGRAHAITGLVVHHTASPTAAASTAPGRFRGIATAHRDLGWIDVAYHWGVDVDGNVYELRDERLAGDTRTDYDPAGWFLVVCEGNFEESPTPRAMLDAVADVLAAGAQRYGVDPSTIRGHRELAATLCPGANLQDRLPALREAVAERLAAGGVALRVDDDLARVAAIESG